MRLKNLPAEAKRQLLIEVYQEAQKRVSIAQAQNPDPIEWIETHFYIPETNAPIKLEPYQKTVIQEALRRDESGAFIYSLILYSDLKKSAKSTIAAAVCLYLAWHTAWEAVRIVANDLKQADSRTFFYIERAIRLNPYLNRQCKIIRYHITLPNNTTITAIPVDPKGEAGGGDLITCFTELWAFKNEAAKRLWSETTLSPLKFGHSLRWCESYAGFDGESPILEQLYQTGKVHGEIVDVGVEGLELYRNDAARMLTLWNTIPRCPWQTPEYYAQEEASLTESEFLRMHRNQWSSSEDVFVPYDWWDGCKSDYESVQHNEPVIMALDAGVSSDCFAVVMVTRRGEKVQVQYNRKWQPEKGTTLDFRIIETEIRRLINENNVLEIAYDPYQLVDMMGRIRIEEAVNVRPFNQTSPRAIADQRLFSLIRNRNIQHRDDHDLNTHIKNSNRKPEDDKMRIIKRTLEGKIDLTIALSMAADRAFAYAFD